MRPLVPGLRGILRVGPVLAGRPLRAAAAARLRAANARALR